MRWLAALPLAVMAALAALFALFALRHDPHVLPHALVGKPMPDLTLTDLDDGTPVRIKDALGPTPTLVNFYASWCAPCEIEHPLLDQLGARKVRIIGIAYKDRPEKTKAFLKRLGDPFAERLTDQDGRAGIEFGVTGVPETFLVAPDGRIIDKHSGPMSAKDAEAFAQAALTGH
jgi:cytochrome c biogenesis protein CcmG/thiol:disulfide interchange protein DsbE